MDPPVMKIIENVAVYDEEVQLSGQEAYIHGQLLNNGPALEQLTRQSYGAFTDTFELQNVNGLASQKCSSLWEKFRF